MAYCYNALFKRLVHPKSKEFVEDIEAATKVYQSESLAEIEFDETEQKMFYYVADLLAFEGYMDLHSRLYKTMLKRAMLWKTDISITSWNSGCLNHGLCASPVDALFMKTLLEHNKESDDMKFWTDSGVRGSWEVGFELCLSVFPTISSDNSRADAHAKKAQKTIDKVKSAASTQGSKDFDNFKARMYYHLAERLIAMGLMTEALTYADKSYSLRDKLLSQSFNIEWHRVEHEVDVQGQTFRKREFVCKRFDMIPERVSPSGNWFHSTPTPWSTVRFYLESALQTGTLQEMIGNADEAETKFLLGKMIATLLNLRMFLVAFKTRLGKIYLKNRFLEWAYEEVKFVQSSLMDDWSSIGCEKCRIIWKVTYYMQCGDHHLSIFKTNGGANKQHLKNAIIFYSQATKNLEHDIWRDNDAGRQETLKTPTFCNDFGIPGACGSKEECWHCLPSLKSSSLKASIQTNWECIRRCYWVRLATRLGKCYKLQGDAKKEYMHLKSSICVLVCRSAFNLQEVSTSFVDTLLSNGVMGDAYGVEHASILYKICCFSLMNKDTGEEVDKLSIESILLGLKLAFILSREVRKLHKKVSRVLAVLYAYLSEDKEFPKCKTISVTQWASYFHQSSIGNYFNSFLLSQDQNPVEVDALRKVLAPHSLDVLKTSVSEFFESLPIFTILCMSMLSEKSDKYVKHLLPESPTSAWIMVSRISLNRGPIHIILPVRERFEDFKFETDAPLDGGWTCPWAHGVFDKLAPVLRRILEVNSKVVTTWLTVDQRIYYRCKLDKHLKDLLRDLQNKWFGHWIYLLLGEWSANEDLYENGIEKYGSQLDDRILRAVFEWVPSNFQYVEVLVNLILNNGCYIERSNPKDDPQKGIVTHIVLSQKESGNKICRNPVIFVLDNEIQMFPLENMPLLEEEPIYRMPSVGSVMWSSSKRKDPKKGKTIIDPFSCFYMFFTDCQETTSCFDKWSNPPHFEGCCIPDIMSTEKLDKLEIYDITLDTLKRALECHDLFVYSGHGDARQYIESDVIRKVNASCVVCLFGCSSGYISNSRTRVPKGAPLDYLLAGSPVIISNLWEVTAKSCEVLARKLLIYWQKAVKALPVDCKDNQQTKFGERLCIHQTDLASLFLRAREIDRKHIFKVDLAGTVIYGLPTCIVRRTD